MKILIMFLKTSLSILRALTFLLKLNAGVRYENLKYRVKNHQHMKIFWRVRIILWYQIESISWKKKKRTFDRFSMKSILVKYRKYFSLESVILIQLLYEGISQICFPNSFTDDKVFNSTILSIFSPFFSKYVYYFLGTIMSFSSIFVISWPPILTFRTICYLSFYLCILPTSIFVI